MDNEIKNAKMRFAAGIINADIYETAIQEYNKRKDGILLELEKWQGDLSNLEKKIPTIIKTAASLSSMWDSAPLDRKRRIQYLIFPDGIIWDKGIQGYRTIRENSFFRFLRIHNGDFGQEKRDQDDISIPSCGWWQHKLLNPIHS